MGILSLFRHAPAVTPAVTPPVVETPHAAPPLFKSYFVHLSQAGLAKAVAARKLRHTHAAPKAPKAKAKPKAAKPKSLTNGRPLVFRAHGRSGQVLAYLRAPQAAPKTGKTTALKGKHRVGGSGKAHKGSQWSGVVRDAVKVRLPVHGVLHGIVAAEPKAEFAEVVTKQGIFSVRRDDISKAEKQVTFDWKHIEQQIKMGLGCLVKVSGLGERAQKWYLMQDLKGKGPDDTVKVAKLRQLNSTHAPVLRTVKVSQLSLWIPKQFEDHEHYVRTRKVPKKNKSREQLKREANALTAIEYETPAKQRAMQAAENAWFESEEAQRELGRTTTSGRLSARDASHYTPPAKERLDWVKEHAAESTEGTETNAVDRRPPHVGRIAARVAYKFGLSQENCEEIAQTARIAALYVFRQFEMDPKEMNGRRLAALARKTAIANGHDLDTEAGKAHVTNLTAQYASTYKRIKGMDTLRNQTALAAAYLEAARHAAEISQDSGVTGLNPAVIAKVERTEKQLTAELGRKPDALAIANRLGWAGQAGLDKVRTALERGKLRRMAHWSEIDAGLRGGGDAMEDRVSAGLYEDPEAARRDAEAKDNQHAGLMQMARLANLKPRELALFEHGMTLDLPKEMAGGPVPRLRGQKAGITSALRIAQMLRREFKTRDTEETVRQDYGKVAAKVAAWGRANPESAKQLLMQKAVSGKCPRGQIFVTDKGENIHVGFSHDQWVKREGGLHTKGFTAPNVHDFMQSTGWIRHHRKHTGETHHYTLPNSKPETFQRAESHANTNEPGGNHEVDVYHNKEYHSFRPEGTQDWLKQFHRQRIAGLTKSIKKAVHKPTTRKVNAWGRANPESAKQLLMQKAMCKPTTRLSKAAGLTNPGPSLTPRAPRRTAPAPVADVKAAVHEHLQSNPKTALSALRHKFGGKAKFDPYQPLKHPVHAALKALIDEGKVESHGGDWGEPRFSAKSSVTKSLRLTPAPTLTRTATGWRLTRTA